MKGLLTLLLTAILAANSQKLIKKFTADINSAKIVWTGHAQSGGYSPSGTIMLKSGEIALEGQKLISAKIAIDMTSLKHANQDLQKHLKQEDFFDTDIYPIATFVLINSKGSQALGLLTIKGVTKKAKCFFSISENTGKIVLKVDMKVDRTLFGIKYNSASYFQDLGSYAISNYFDLSLECTFSLP